MPNQVPYQVRANSECVKIKSDQLNCVSFENCGTETHMRTYAHTTYMFVPSTIPSDGSSSKLPILK